jgi:hypothetical protein
MIERPYISTGAYQPCLVSTGAVCSFQVDSTRAAQHHMITYMQQGVKWRAARSTTATHPHGRPPSTIGWRMHVDITILPPYSRVDFQSAQHMPHGMYQPAPIKIAQQVARQEECSSIGGAQPPSSTASHRCISAMPRAYAARRFCGFRPAQHRTT